MGDKINLKLDKREHKGKKVAKLREAGIIPGVIYGQGFEPILFQGEYNVIEKAIREAGKHTPLQVTVDGKNKITLVKDIDRDPAKSLIRHISLHAVKANEVVTAEIPIHLIGKGESPAERAGLIVLQAIEHIEVKAKPADLPESLEISILGLESTDHKITFADIQLPEGVVFADSNVDAELVVANVYEPAALEAANEAAAGEASEVTDVEIEGEAEISEAGEKPTENKS